ncbi:MAG: signal recognition particle protein [Candidatus Bipolaricaulia bacterium]
MLEQLSEKLTSVLTRLRRQGMLSEADLDEGLKQVRLVLLEADVHYRVVKRFVDRVREVAVGERVMDSLTPGQQVIKIVRDQLAAIMGGERVNLDLSGQPTILMLVGLQGSGKTTTAGKLARLLKHEGKAPALVATDVYRPAAIEQLKQLGDDLGLPTFAEGETAVEIAVRALTWAKQNARDVIILDTAGRLQIDQEMMAELEETDRVIQPTEVLFVADAMTGQEAVNVATAFHERLELDGVILTKLDGDARGGAALSIREVIGVPIKFVGTGEKLDALEPFHPDRMAEWILGMGDVLTLIEKAESAFDAEQTRKLEEKIRKDRFTLQDFLEQLHQVRDMGPLSEIIGKLPGMNRRIEVDERELDRIAAIINSMTVAERENSAILNSSRKKRIARGSGTQVSDVNRLLKRFDEARRLMKQMEGRWGRSSGRLPF